MKKMGLMILLISMSSLALAQAYIPDDETQVLVEVEQTSHLQELKALRQQLGHQVNNQALLSSIIAHYLKLGREHADERYFSYAESLLKPYLDSGQLNSELQVQWADILQRQHQFTEAMDILNHVLKSDRANTQARLMRAVILQAKGQYPQAMQDCKALLGRVNLLLSTTCIAQIDGLQGHLARSIPLLQQTIERYKNSDDETLRWSRTALAEMLMRAGRPQQAIEYLKAVHANTNDYYALAVNADILLQLGRYDEVMALLSAHRQVSKLLLRYVIAANQSGKLQAVDNDTLSAAIQRAQLLAARAHKRLLARYYLDVKNNPELAVSIARENWQEQREPDDALLLVRCLRAVNDQAGLKSFMQTRKDNALFDVRIESLLQEVVL